MKFENLVILLNILQVYSFQQSDYRVIHERISVEWYNTRYFKDLKATMFHYRRYEKRFNFSGYILQDLGMEITNTVQAYKFQSNEYREFPVLYTCNACSVFTTDLFGMAPTNIVTNITLCPIKAGFYYGANISVDESKFPPYAPRGRFMLEISGYYKKDILLGRGRWYGAIEPTNPLEHVIL